MKTILSMLLFFSFLTHHATAKMNLKKLSFVSYCRITDLEDIRTTSFPGHLCQFLPDGTFVSATQNAIRRISPTREILWETPGHFHHQINISPDGKRILALSSDFDESSGVKKRVDATLVISLENGKVLHRQSALEILRQAEIPALKFKMTFANQELLKTEEELSHFNSIYEIDETASAHPAIKKGNIIVNGLEQGFYVLSSDLQKVVHHEILPSSVGHRVHDVQVTSEGNILFFNNHTVDPETAIKFSSIQEWDPIKKRLIFTFSPTPKGTFYSAMMGGVQKLNDELYLFEGSSGTAYVYSRTSQTFTATLPHYGLDSDGAFIYQQLKAVDLSHFAKAWSANWSGRTPAKSQQ